MAYEIPLTIAEVMNDISKNKYVLPSIQRDYVWCQGRVQFDPFGRLKVTQ